MTSTNADLTRPAAGKLAKSVAIAALIAAVVLVLFVLPVEYGIDPTGLGARMGLTAMREPQRTLQIQDVIGGNEAYRTLTIPDAGEPTPLPNPAVSQLKPAAARKAVKTITLQPGQETEIKAVLDPAQVIVYSWQAEGGEVYTDFHGHEPGAGDSFVRYEEQQSGNAGHGSLVSPFKGEHGWYWVNISDNPVTITLEVTGYFSELIDYGLLR
ncbi:MAG: hypothetical protein SXG53_14265 [Pseudomonadota bacterium]|nr:hypothetical protein [Pseudomonadota bacterium]